MGLYEVARVKEDEAADEMAHVQVRSIVNQNHWHPFSDDSNMVGFVMVYSFLRQILIRESESSSGSEKLAELAEMVNCPMTHVFDPADSRTLALRWHSSAPYGNVRLSLIQLQHYFIIFFRHLGIPFGHQSQPRKTSRVYSPFLKERRRSYRTVSYRKSITNISKHIVIPSSTARVSAYKLENPP